MVVYASFDSQSLANYVEEQAGDELNQRTYRGITVYEASSDNSGPSFSFVNDDMMIAATRTELIDAMIDRLEGNAEALSSNDEVMDLVATASVGQSGWLVALKPEMVDLNESKADGRCRKNRFADLVGYGIRGCRIKHRIAWPGQPVSSCTQPKKRLCRRSGQFDERYGRSNEIAS